MKTRSVRRKGARIAPKRAPRETRPALPQLAEPRRAYVGQPSAPAWLTLEEKRRRAERLGRRNGDVAIPAALDRGHDVAAVELLSSVKASYAPGGGAAWPEVPFYRPLCELPDDKAVAWRAMALIEAAIVRLFPLRAHERNGVVWLNDRHARSIDDIVAVLDEAMRVEPAAPAAVPPEVVAGPPKRVGFVRRIPPPEAGDAQAQ